MGGISVVVHGLRPPECENLHGKPTQRDCLSHSRIGTYLSCEQKFKWQYIDRLEPKVKAESLNMGGAFAHALEVGDPNSGYALLMREQQKSRGQHAGNPWVVLPTNAQAQVAATIVQAASAAYLDRFGTHASREVTYRQRIRNPDTGRLSKTFDVQARVDGVAGRDLVEDKLQAKIERVTEKRLEFDRQVTLGAYLHWRCTGELFENIRYRITRKPSIRQKQKESFDDYLQRIAAEYRERPEWYVQEFVLQRTKQDFIRLEQELWTWTQQIRATVTAGVYPRNVASCADYSGCAMIDLCAQTPGAIHQFREKEVVV